MLIFIQVLYLGRTGLWVVLESPLMSKQYGDLRGWKCSSFFFPEGSDMFAQMMLPASLGLWDKCGPQNEVYK